MILLLVLSLIVAKGSGGGKAFEHTTNDVELLLIVIVILVVYLILNKNIETWYQVVISYTDYSMIGVFLVSYIMLFVILQIAYHSRTIYLHIPTHLE